MVSPKQYKADFEGNHETLTTKAFILNEIMKFSFTIFLRYYHAIW